MSDNTPRLMERTRAAELGRETVVILERGDYQTSSGKVVSIRDALRQAVEQTRTHPPDEVLPPVVAGTKPTRFEVVNETTLEAAKRLLDEGLRPLALNFASAHHPGGGFLSGARAQEESLARSSGLYACLQGNPFYDYHHTQNDALYSDYAIYAPEVPIIRRDDGTLLDEPYPCSFLTCAAVNAKRLLRSDPARQGEIRPVMGRRIRRVLTLMAQHNFEAIILGAWGCGAFGNDGEEIATSFRTALLGDFHGVFARVVFAILDWSPERQFLGPFQRAFPS